MTGYKNTPRDATPWDTGESLAVGSVHHQVGSAPGSWGTGWIHCYYSVQSAVYLNPIHSDYHDDGLRIWEVEGSGLSTRCGALTCYNILSVQRELPVPVLGPMHRMVFGLLCWAVGEAQKGWLSAEQERWIVSFCSGLDRGLESWRDVAASMPTRLRCMMDMLDGDMIEGPHAWYDLLRLEGAGLANDAIGDFTVVEYADRIAQIITPTPDHRGVLGACLEEGDIRKAIEGTL